MTERSNGIISKGLRFLILEDVDVDYQVIHKQLSAIGFNMDKAWRYKGLSDIGSDVAPDIIFLDLNLEDSKGIDSVIKTREKFDSQPIIVLTGADDIQIATDAIESGAADFLVKGEYNNTILFKTLIVAQQRFELLRKTRESEERYRNLIEESHEVVMILSEENEITFISNHIKELTGFLPEDVIGTSAENYIHYDDLQIRNEKLGLIKENNEKRVGYEQRIRTKSGAYIWVSAIVTDHRETEGINGFVVNFKSIEERKSAESELIRSEKRYRHLAERLPVMLMRLNAKGKIEYLNQYGQEVLGGSSQGILENALAEYIYSEDQELFEEKARLSAISEENARLDARLITPDGLRWFRIYLSPEYNLRGEFSSWTASAIDVNEERALTIKIQNEARKSENILRSIKDGFFTMNKDWIVTSWNRAAEESMGIKANDIIGKNLWTIFDKEKYKTYYEASVNAMKTRKPHENVAFTEELSKWFWSVSYPSDQGVNVLFRDITASRTAADKLEKEAERLQKAQENGKIGDWELDLRTGEMSWSPILYEILGVNPSSKADSSEVIEPEDRKRLQKALDRAVKNGEPFDLDLKLRSPDNRFRYVRDLGVPEKDENGKVVKVRGITQDISERKESEEHFTKLFYQSPLPQLVHHPDSLLVLDVNDAMVQQYGYSRSELLGMNIKDLHPKHSMSDLTVEESNQQSDILRKVKSTHIDKHNNEIAVEVYARPFEFHGEAAVLTTIIDVTAEDNALEALKQSNERFELVTQATRNVIWDWDLLRGKMYRSNAYEKIFGQIPEVIPGNVDDWKGHLHPGDEARLEKSIAKFLESDDTIWAEEYRLQRADGSYAHIRDRGVALRDDKGTAYRMIGAMEDISTQKEIEKHRELLESVVTNSRDSIIITEAYPDENGNRKMLYVNEATLNMTGNSRENLIGKDPRVFQGRLSNRRDIAAFKKALDNWEPHAVELINYRKDGSKFWIDIRTLPVKNAEGEYTHWVSIERDVTASKLAEHSKDLVLKASSVLNKHVSLSARLTEIIKVYCEELRAAGGEVWMVENQQEKINRFCHYAKNKKLESSLEKRQVENEVPWLDMISNKYFLNIDLHKASEQNLWESCLVNDECESMVVFPIMAKDIPIAYFSFFMPHPASENEWYQNVFKNIALSLGAELVRVQVEDELNRFFDLSPDILAITDLEGRLLKGNPALEGLTGFTLDKLLNRPMENFIHPDDKGRSVFQNISQSAKVKNVHFSDIRLVKKNGKTTWLSWAAVVKRDERKVYNVAKDITDQMKYLSAVKEQNSKLRDIAWTQSHEIRGPLTQIMGLLGLLEVEGDNKKLKEMMIKSSEELDNIIRKVIRTSEEIKNL